MNEEPEQEYDTFIDSNDAPKQEPEPRNAFRLHASSLNLPVSMPIMNQNVGDSASRPTGAELDAEVKRLAKLRSVASSVLAEGRQGEPPVPWDMDDTSQVEDDVSRVNQTLTSLRKVANPMYDTSALTPSFGTEHNFAKVSSRPREKFKTPHGLLEPARSQPWMSGTTLSERRPSQTQAWLAQSLPPPTPPPALPTDSQLQANIDCKSNHTHSINKQVPPWITRR